MGLHSVKLLGISGICEMTACGVFCVALASGIFFSQARREVSTTAVDFPQFNLIDGL